jgi:hypothetical protein
MRNHIEKHPEAGEGGTGFKKRLRSYTRWRSRQQAIVIANNNNNDNNNRPAIKIKTTAPITGNAKSKISDASRANVDSHSSRSCEPKRKRMLQQSPSEMSSDDDFEVKF